MVPLQRQIIAAELSRQAEKSKNGGSSSGSHGSFQNKGRGGQTRTETVKYVNESEKDG
jgi:hypothetical protein